MRKTPLLVLLFPCLFPFLVSAAEIFPTSSIWRFRPGTNEASTPVSTWRTPGFNDTNAGFVNAPAPFWYGDAYSGGTQLPAMQNSYSCIFLRKTFVVTNAAQIGLLRLGVVVDDGFIAWINGTEVRRI